MLVQESTLYEARPCRCKSGFCDGCCESWGIGIRTKLIPVVETFTAVQMWTLTIDPTLFNDPREAFEYEKRNRCISRLVRNLKKRGLVHSERWFAVVEWHQNGYAHWHVIVDASFIPKELVQAIWDRFRPASAGPKADNRPGFGIVRFSTRRLASKRHAAQYATKYLIKPPKFGYPDWVLDYEGQIRRVRHSQGLFPKRKTPVPAEERSREEPEGSEERKKDPELAPSTIRERRERCGSQTVLIARHSRTYSDGSHEVVPEFLGVLKRVSFQDSKDLCGVGDFHLRVLALSPENVNRLRIHDERRGVDFRASLLASISESRDNLGKESQ